MSIKHAMLILLLAAPGLAVDNFSEAPSREKKQDENRAELQSEAGEKPESAASADGGGLITSTRFIPLELSGISLQIEAPKIGLTSRLDPFTFAPSAGQVVVPMHEANAEESSSSSRRNFDAFKTVPISRRRTPNPPAGNLAAGQPVSYLQAGDGSNPLSE